MIGTMTEHFERQAERNKKRNDEDYDEGVEEHKDVVESRWSIGSGDKLWSIIPFLHFPLHFVHLLLCSCSFFVSLFFLLICLLVSFGKAFVNFLISFLINLGVFLV